MKLGHGRYALIGHHGKTTPSPPRILRCKKKHEQKESFKHRGGIHNEYQKVTFHFHHTYHNLGI
jgi:hypothetical protein